MVIKNLIYRYFSAKEKPQIDEPEEESPPPEEVQHQLMEVTKTLQSLQNVVKRFRHRTSTVSNAVLITKKQGNKGKC